MVIGDTNMEHEIHTSVCDPDSEQFFRPALRGHGLPFRRISSKRAVIHDTQAVMATRSRSLLEYSYGRLM